MQTSTDVFGSNQETSVCVFLPFFIRSVNSRSITFLLTVPIKIDIICLKYKRKSCNSHLFFTLISFLKMVQNREWQHLFDFSSDNLRRQRSYLENTVQNKEAEKRQLFLSFFLPYNFKKAQKSSNLKQALKTAINLYTVICFQGMVALVMSVFPLYTIVLLEFLLLL